MALLKPFVSNSPTTWVESARERVENGLAALSVGEIIVTDRLHGMLLALQMGRSVIAVDNNNAKLTSYAETWFGAAQPDLVFAKTMPEALVRARRGFKPGRATP